jgi:hypothetical protein
MEVNIIIDNETKKIVSWEDSQFSSVISPNENEQLINGVQYNDDEEFLMFSKYIDGQIDTSEALSNIATIEKNSKLTEFSSTIQNLLDSKAQEHRYDNMMSVRSYAGYENPFQEEAQSLAVWASNCWVKAGEIEAEVSSGNIEVPTVEEVLAQMPVYS